jgi:hypothetical protein
VRSGIPQPHRGQAWFTLSGAADRARAAPHEYQQRLEEAREEVRWYGSGAAARLRAKIRAGTAGGARVCSCGVEREGEYSAAVVHAGSYGGMDIEAVLLQPASGGEAQARVAVVAVAAGSAAEAAGIHAGDTVLGVSIDDAAGWSVTIPHGPMGAMVRVLDEARSKIDSRPPQEIIFWHCQRTECVR